MSAIDKRYLISAASYLTCYQKPCISNNIREVWIKSPFFTYLKPIEEFAFQMTIISLNLCQSVLHYWYQVCFAKMKMTTGSNLIPSAESFKLQIILFQFVVSCVWDPGIRYSSFCESKHKKRSPTTAMKPVKSVIWRAVTYPDTASQAPHCRGCPACPCP